jgi:hypothetical protein
MAMVVKNNMEAVNTLNTLNRNQSALAQSLQKVSSGMKINHAGDDPSGLAISERMRVQVRALDQDHENTVNGNAMMRTAEGAVQSTIEVLRTLKEKAINAANDTNTDEDRAIIQKEVDRLIDQIDENALTTYNGKYLVDGSHNTRVTGPMPAPPTPPEGTYTSLTNYKLSTDTGLTARYTNLKDRNGQSLGIQSTDTLTISWTRNGVTYTGEFSPLGNINIVNSIGAATNYAVGAYSASNEIGVDASGTTVYTVNGERALTMKASRPGVDGQIAGMTFSITDKSGKPRLSANAVLDSFRESVRAQNPSPDNGLVLHTGTRANQSVKVGLTDMRAAALGLQSSDGNGWNHAPVPQVPPAVNSVVGGGPKLSVLTQTAANAAINVIESALQKATDQIVAIGAVQIRLNYTGNNLTTASENVQASESTIRDADMAKEMTSYTKHNVLTQAAQSMLAQANQNSSMVLSLLK